MSQSIPGSKREWQFLSCFRCKKPRAIDVLMSNVNVFKIYILMGHFNELSLEGSAEISHDVHNHTHFS